MKHLSIIIFAVVMAIFATACSSEQPLEINKNQTLIFTKPVKLTKFLSYDESDGKITIYSTDGEYHLTLREKYDIKQYAQYHVKYDPAWTVDSFLSFGLSNKVRTYIHQGMAFRTNGHILALLNIGFSGENVEVQSVSESELPTEEGVMVPAMRVEYTYFSSPTVVWIPILDPIKELSPTGNSNLEEFIQDGKLKCFLAI